MLFYGVNQDMIRQYHPDHRLSRIYRKLPFNVKRCTTS